MDCKKAISFAAIALMMITVAYSSSLKSSKEIGETGFFEEKSPGQPPQYEVADRRLPKSANTVPAKTWCCPPTAKYGDYCKLCHGQVCDQPDQGCPYGILWLFEDSCGKNSRCNGSATSRHRKFFHCPVPGAVCKICTGEPGQLSIGRGGCPYNLFYTSHSECSKWSSCAQSPKVVTAPTIWPSPGTAHTTPLIKYWYSNCTSAPIQCHLCIEGYGNGTQCPIIIFSTRRTCEAKKKIACPRVSHFAPVGAPRTGAKKTAAIPETSECYNSKRNCYHYGKKGCTVMSSYTGNRNYTIDGARCWEWGLHGLIIPKNYCKILPGFGLKEAPWCYTGPFPSDMGYCFHDCKGKEHGKREQPTQSATGNR